MNKSSSKPNLASAFRQLESQLARLQGLESEVATLRRQVSVKPPATSRPSGNSQTGVPAGLETVSRDLTDRRGMLKKVGSIAAGVAAVGLLRPVTGGAQIKSPDNTGTGMSVDLGETNSASGTANTIIRNASTALSQTVFAVANVGTIFAASPPTGSRTAGYFYTNNNGGTPTTGNVHALYAVALAPAGGTSIGLHAEGKFGVRAIGETNGIGVYATSFGSADSVGVTAVSDFGYGGVFSSDNIGLYVSGRAALQFGLTSPNPQTSVRAYTVGDVACETTGDLWYCTASGVGNSGAQFRKLAGPNSSGTTHVLPTPIRYVDTRNGTGGFSTPFAANSARSFNFTTLQPGTIPAKARGIFGNITAANPAGNGNLQTNTANSFPAGSAAVMSFRTGVNLSNHFVSALDANGLMFVRANFASTHVVIDIQGYYI